MAQSAQRPPVSTLESTDSPAAPDLSDALAGLAERYTFRRPEEVITYLRRFPHLIPLLNEAADVIPRYFGENAQPVLEVFFGREFDDQIGQLFAEIRTSLDDEAYDRLERFDEEWWYETPITGPGVLVFDIEHF